MVKNSTIPLIAFFITALLILGTQKSHASTLDLLGVGWNKPEVTILIKAAKRVTQEAVEDVEQAVEEWDDALQGAGASFNLTMLYGVKKADIIIHMRVGGGAVLGQTLPKTVSRFSCALKWVSIQLSGKAFGQDFSSTGTRNVARHELGHALGLGHSDDPNDLMYATADSSEIFGDVEVEISDCDIDGIDAIYPLPTNCMISDYITCP